MHSESKVFQVAFTHVSLCVSLQVCSEHTVCMLCGISTYNTIKHCLTHLRSDSRLVYYEQVSVLLYTSFLLLWKFDVLITENTPNIFLLSFLEYNCQISILELLQRSISALKFVFVFSEILCLIFCFEMNSCMIYYQ